MISIARGRLKDKGQNALRIQTILSLVLDIRATFVVQIEFQFYLSTSCSLGNLCPVASVHSSVHMVLFSTT